MLRGGAVVQSCFVKNCMTLLADKRWSEGGPGGEFLSGRQSSNARVPPGTKMCSLLQCGFMIV
jgi:hypothetical protein